MLALAIAAKIRHAGERMVSRGGAPHHGDAPARRWRAGSATRAAAWSHEAQRMKHSSGGTRDDTAAGIPGYAGVQLVPLASGVVTLQIP